VEGTPKDGVGEMIIQIVFKPLTEIIPAESGEVSSPETQPLNQVAESIKLYKGKGE